MLSGGEKHPAFLFSTLVEYFLSLRHGKAIERCAVRT